MRKKTNNKQCPCAEVAKKIDAQQAKRREIIPEAVQLTRRERDAILHQHFTGLVDIKYCGFLMGSSKDELTTTRIKEIEQRIQAIKGELTEKQLNEMEWEADYAFGEERDPRLWEIFHHGDGRRWADIAEETQSNKIFTNAPDAPHHPEKEYLFPRIWSSRRQGHNPACQLYPAKAVKR